jgi:hypothetical protein
MMAAKHLLLANEADNEHAAATTQQQLTSLE